MLRVRDIMTTSVTTVAPSTSLREAAELLSARHISGAPVVDGARVVGVVSASDILAFVGSTSAAPEEREEPDPADEWDEWDERAGWEATDDAPSRYFIERWQDPAADVVEQFSEAPVRGWDALDAHTVGEVMTRAVISLQASAPVTAAAERLRDADIHRALVMDGDELLGILTSTDLVRALADGRAVRRTYVFDTSPLDRDHDAGEY